MATLAQLWPQRYAYGQHTPDLVGRIVDTYPLRSRFGILLPTSSSLFGFEILECGLNLVESGEECECMFGDRALVIGPQIKEFAPGVRQTPGFGYTFRTERFVAQVIVTRESLGLDGEHPEFWGRGTRAQEDYRVTAAGCTIETHVPHFGQDTS